MGKDPNKPNPEPKGKLSFTEAILFALAVLAAIAIIGKGLNEKDPEITPVPPSVPTDVGTLKPTR
jgi:hypothetical protein